ncbi:MAG: pyridoxamine 5'-phosphate oxidase family protein [Nocardioidaceae bacterium]
MAELIELPERQCWEMLRGSIVGRIAICTPSGPRILPVNYAVHDDAVVFRTSPSGEIGSHAVGRNLAFEVDHIDYERHQGWSVLLLGEAELVDDVAELDRIRRVWDPRPWADGDRVLYLRLRARQVTGRALGNDWRYDTMMPVRRTV